MLFYAVGELLNIEAKDMLLSLNGNDEVSMADLIAQVASMATEMADMKEALAVRTHVPSAPAPTPFPDTRCAPYQNPRFPSLSSVVTHHVFERPAVHYRFSMQTVQSKDFDEFATEVEVSDAIDAAATALQKEIFADTDAKSGATNTRVDKLVKDLAGFDATKATGTSTEFEHRALSLRIVPAALHAGPSTIHCISVLCFVTAIIKASL